MVVDKKKDGVLENFTKARSRNALEDRLLKRNLDNIDHKLKNSLYNINNEIRQQRRLVVMFRNEMSEIRRSVLDSERELRSTSHSRDKFGSMESCDKMPVGEPREIKVAGQRVSITTDIRPHMLFWSQDASTKLPAMTGFYGYRFNFQRSLTEIKLLGQNVYPDGNSKRDVQSADPLGSRETINQNLMRIHTSAPKTAPHNYYREDTRLSVHPPPPPTREATYPVTFAHEKAVPKIPNKSDKSNVPLEDINLNLKSLPNDEELVNDTNRSSVRNRIKGTAPGDLRTPDIAKRQKSCLAEALFKTREEATRSNQLSTLRKIASGNTKQSKKTTISNLERSYTHVPVLLSEVNRLKSDTARQPSKSARQYTKTAFGLNMQSAISRKVLNKSALPVAFRKNYSTYLKHYGTPIMEERLAPHYNTPVSVLN